MQNVLFLLGYHTLCTTKRSNTFFLNTLYNKKRSHGIISNIQNDRFAVNRHGSYTISCCTFGDMSIFSFRGGASFTFFFFFFFLLRVFLRRALFFFFCSHCLRFNASSRSNSSRIDLPCYDSPFLAHEQYNPEGAIFSDANCSQSCTNFHRLVSFPAKESYCAIVTLGCVCDTSLVKYWTCTRAPALPCWDK